MPNSSPVTAKMKSVWASGRMRLTVPFARPLAEPAAGQETVERGVDLKRIDDAAAGAGIEEFQDAGAHMRHEFIGEQRAAEARPRRCPTTQNQCSPAMKNSAAQTSETSIVWPKSGWRISGTIGHRQQQDGDQVGGNVAPLAALREGPGDENDEGRLQELRGLDAEDPAPRSLDLMAEEQARR